MRRTRRPLVCQYLENLRSADLERYADIIRDLASRQHGVYALYRKRRLYYVGLASNLRGRIRTHVRDRHAGKWDCFSVYLTIDDGHMRELESLIIRIAMPRGNHQRGRFARAENLMAVLKTRLRARHVAELRSLGTGLMAQDPARARRDARRRRKRDEPVLAAFVDGSIRLRRTYKAKTYNARVLKNGKVRFDGRLYLSPTDPASEIVGRRINGWWFWHYERAPGRWVKLKELRR